MSQPANDEFSQHLSDDEASNHEDASDTGAAPKQQQQVIPQTTAISNIKLPILKKEEYDIWAMEMEHYLEYIDNDVWKVIQNGNSKKRISTGKDGVIRILPPVSPAEIQAVEKERKAKNILLMAIPKEHMRRFHGMDDAKEIWEAIRTRFGGNANSKKMQKAVFKQQFEAFTISSSEGLEKGYDRFQQLLSQLEAHGAEVSTEDANHKFLRSLPPAWSNLAMTMRTKPDVDTLSIDDLDIEEMDINWQIAMIAIRMKKFYKKKRRRVSKGTHDGKKKRDSFYQHQEARKQEKNQMGLLTMDDGIVNWGEHTEVEETNHALMAISSSMKSSDGNSSSSDIAKLTHAVNQQTSVVTTAMTAILKQFQATPPPASVKAIEEICVTCGGPHPYYQCLAADGNTFPEYRDNIQGYVAAATGNYNQGNSGYRPPGVANQTRPPGFIQQNGQNNQNRFSQPQGYNRGNNFNQNTNYQAPIQQNQSVPLNELENFKKTNEANMKAMQTQINNVKNELRNEMQNSIQTSMSNQTNKLKNMMASFFQMNTASTSGSGSLPSNTVANPKGELKDITTQSGLVLDGPTILMPPLFINPEEDECVEETLTDLEHGEYTIKVPPPQVQKVKPPS
ncbi:hypothetical protein Tco_0672301 [Tanacetum coccineum]